MSFFLFDANIHTDYLLDLGTSSGFIITFVKLLCESDLFQTYFNLYNRLCLKSAANTCTCPYYIWRINSKNHVYIHLFYLWMNYLFSLLVTIAPHHFLLISYYKQIRNRLFGMKYVFGMVSSCTDSIMRRRWKFSATHLPLYSICRWPITLGWWHAKELIMDPTHWSLQYRMNSLFLLVGHIRLILEIQGNIFAFTCLYSTKSPHFRVIWTRNYKIGRKFFCHEDISVYCKYKLVFIVCRTWMVYLGRKFGTEVFLSWRYFSSLSL